MSKNGWTTFRVYLFVLSIITIIFLFPIKSAPAHDHDHPDHNQWYSELRQPDNPHIPCCGEKDAYWCDEYFAKDGKAFCRVTDDRVIEGRPPVPVGTVIHITTHKLKWEQNGKPTGNPTGHSVVFLSSGGAVFCFVQAGGV